MLRLPRFSSRSWEQSLRVAGTASAIALLGMVAGMAMGTRHWPLVNDPALMHYVVLLAQHGRAPYREIGDYNLPGAYLPEWLSTESARVLHLPLSVMWRCFDWAAMALAGLAMMHLAGPDRRFAGLWAGALFALYHGNDGVGQSGQRDLWMTVAVLWAVALLQAAARANEVVPWRVLGFGLCVGTAATIKPFGLLWALCLLPWLPPLGAARHGRLLLGAAAGLLLPWLAMAVLLSHWRAWAAFAAMMRWALPYHASLAKGQVSALLLASSPSSIVKLLLVAGLVLPALLWKERGRFQRLRTPEYRMLLLALLLGLGSFVAQGKGYSYQRYPYVAFVFLLCSLLFDEGVRSPASLLRVAGVCGFGFGVLFCAPAYMRHAVRSAWPVDVTQAIEQALRVQAPLGGLAHLSGRVQCVDVVTGCTDALLALGLPQTTGTVYDELLFQQTPSPWGHVYTGPSPGAPVPEAIVGERKRFQAGMLAQPPQVVVVTSWLFPEGPDDYKKLALWPWFDTFLQQGYAVAEERRFARAENGPMGFRVYVHR